MRLTPRDIQEKEFSSGFRGYKEEEVDAFLDEVTEAYEAVFKENLDLREEVEKLREECKKYEAIGERMQGALVAAQETADDVRKNAQKEAENIVREAELKAQKLVQESKDKHLDLKKQLASLKQVEEEFRFKLKSMLQSYLKLLEELPFGERKEVKELLVTEEEVEKVEVPTAPLAVKEEAKEEAKEEVEEEPKVAAKEEVKAEVKEEAKVELKEEIKEEPEEKEKEKAEEKVPIPFDVEEEKPAVRKLTPKEAKAKAEQAAKPSKGRKKEEKEAKEERGEKEEKEEKEEIEIIEDETFWKDT